MAAPEPWFEQAIAVGLVRLAALQLPGTPPDAQTAAACRAVWVDALWHGRVWIEAADTARLEMAFRILSSRITRWPAPVQLLDVLPMREPMQALPKSVRSYEARAQAMVSIGELMRKLKAGA